MKQFTWDKFILEKSNDEKWIKLCQLNKLEGYLYYNKRHLISKKYIQLFSNTWRSQWAYNELYLNELSNLALEFKKIDINPILLKGISLLEDHFSDKGSRFMSDIDLLVKNKEMHKIFFILQNNGYKSLKDNKWDCNNFKHIMIKIKEGKQIVIELHTRLFYHVINPPIPQIINHSLAPYRQLNIEWTFIHLVGHGAFQHTLIKFFWIIDVYHHLKKYSDHADWNEIYKLACIFRLKKSVCIFFYIIEKYFNFKIPITAIKLFSYREKFYYSWLLSKKSLLSGKQFGIRYYLLKHLTKDSLVEAFKYDLKWFLRFFK